MTDMIKCKENKDKRNQNIGFVRFIACVLVVAIHFPLLGIVGKAMFV